MPINTFTKIVATIGPASEEKLEEMLTNHVDVCRLGFSHGTHAEHGRRLQKIREISKKLNRPIAIIADLQGPKNRIGKFKNGKITLTPNQIFSVYTENKLGDETGVQLPNPEVYKVLSVGQKILLNDGYVALEVLEFGKDYAKTKVLYGSSLSDHKGFNVPNTILDIPIITPKDEEDLKYALSLEVDYVAISFVQTAQDVIDAKKIINGRAKVITKVEKPSAIDDLVNIVKESDAIMIARGDLAVEMSNAIIPSLQREMIAECQRQGKPVIVATQMMESMITNPLPTRAEASDVATAVFLGADAVMTSAETTVGDYPLETVQIMTDIIKESENSKNWSKYLSKSARNGIKIETMKDAVAISVSQMAQNVDAKAIVCLSITGQLASKISSYRGDTQILSLTRNEKLANQGQLFWGMKTHVLEENEDPTIATLKTTVTKYVKEILHLQSGDNVIITSGQRSSDDKSVMVEGLSDSVSILKI